MTKALYLKAYFSRHGKEYFYFRAPVDMRGSVPANIPLGHERAAAIARAKKIVEDWRHDGAPPSAGCTAGNPGMGDRFAKLDEDTRAALVAWLRERARFHLQRSSTTTEPAVVEYDVHAMGALNDAADALERAQYEMSPWPEEPG